MAKVEHYKLKKTKDRKPSMVDTDGITVDGTLFVNNRILSAIADKCEYLQTREARHKASLVRQGDELSRWKDVAIRGIALGDRQMHTMNVMENAIRYWGRAYDSAMWKFKVAMGFAVTMILLVAGLAGFIFCRENGIKVPFIDQVEMIAGGH